MTTRDNRLLFITWTDKREVNLLTTLHNGSTFRKRVRAKGVPGNHREVDQPRAIFHYTQFMGGVDLADQQTAYNASQHRCLKWWKKVVLSNLLEVCMGNAKVVYKKLNPGMKVRADKFRLGVISGLLEGYERPVKPFCRPTSHPSRRLMDRHFIENNPNKTPSGKQSWRDCEVCSDRTTKEARHQTQYMCMACDIPLCVHPCFRRHHTLSVYKMACDKERSMHK